MCIFSWVLIAVIIILFLVLALYSNILRDTIDNPAALQANAGAKFANTPLSNIPRPYSLSRTQLAIWTTVISCSYVYLFFCQGCQDMTINNTALILMGISAATAAAGNIIDQNQSQSSVQSATPTTPPRHQNQPSQGFFIDILSDENGISIHRFQNVVWTAIAIIVYVYKVAQTHYAAGCGLPNLDNTLIALTGISSATYVGLKINENK